MAHARLEIPQALSTAEIAIEQIPGRPKLRIFHTIVVQSSGMQTVVSENTRLKKRVDEIRSWDVGKRIPHAYGAACRDLHQHEGACPPKQMCRMTPAFPWELYKLTPPNSMLSG
jgi:hypothetical protein